MQIHQFHAHGKSEKLKEKKSLKLVFKMEEIIVNKVLAAV
jgi:hypothetical protein